MWLTRIQELTTITIIMRILTTHNISIHGVRKFLDLLDLTFADYLELYGTFSLNDSPLFLQMRGEIGGQLMNNWWNWTIGWVYEIFKIFQGFTQSRYPSHANSRDKESLNSSTQAKPEEQLEEQHRQGAAVQPYPGDYITRPVALVQHCIVAEEQHRGACSSSREAEEHLSGMCVA